MRTRPDWEAALARMAHGGVPHGPGPMTCPSCGSPAATEEVKLTEHAVGPGDQPPLFAKVPVGYCPACDFEWTDYRAEEALTVMLLARWGKL